MRINILTPMIIARYSFGFVIACLFIVLSANAEEILVDTPKALKTAIGKAKPGDEIILRNGEWKDAEIRFIGHGKADAPIVLRAETSGQVKLGGSSRLSIGGSWLEVRGLLFTNGSSGSEAVVEFRGSSSQLASNCSLVDCAVIDYGSENDPDSKWISVYGRSNTVENCHFSGKTNSGCTFVVWLNEAIEPNNHIIRGNYFGPRPVGDGNGFETIRIGTSSRSHLESQTLVEGNYFEACNGEIEVISNKSCGNIYRSNIFDSCEGQLTLRHGDRCIVENNSFYGGTASKPSGVRVIGGGHIVRYNYFQDLSQSGMRSAISLMSGEKNPKPSGYFPVLHTEVTANVFVDCRLAFGIGVESSSKPTVVPPTDSIFMKNTVVGSSGNVLEFYCDSPGLKFEMNQVVGMSAPDVEGFKVFPDPNGALSAATLREKPDVKNYGPKWMR